MVRGTYFRGTMSGMTDPSPMNGIDYSPKAPTNNYIKQLPCTRKFSLAWPDPIFAQGHYRFQYKGQAQKGSGSVYTTHAY